MNLNECIEHKSKKIFSQPPGEKRVEIRDTLSKIYFGNNPPPDISNLLNRGNKRVHD
jgi:hypothetical protein